ncbi:hypothetical protein SADUNF_Sadunf14G0066200 [Salix dunnii]|uniref:Uncharacterized protein n=1 Tax=Salix dunnii TaxID=1413687 RepID=A0A835MJP5_9ROSI|nr:hypothetical protein SADUNF_Sadunf14G0066200 [Salix dunnii]
MPFRVITHEVYGFGWMGFAKARVSYLNLRLVRIMSNDNLKFSLRSIVEKNKLNGTNFLDWERNLRIILRSEGREDILATPVPTVTNTSSDEEKAIATRVKSEALPVTCLMLAAMEPDLQKRFEHSDAYSIITELKTLFQDQARIERYETHKAILDSHLVKGKPVSPHVIKLTGLFKRMENLGTPYDQELATDIVLRSLHDGFAPFRMQYHMNGLKHDLNELHSMLKNAEGNIIGDKKKEVLNVNNGKGFKRVAKSKSNYQGKSKQVAKPKDGEKPKVAVDHDCFYCKAKGHWKRNYPKYLEDKRNGTVSSTSGIYVIEIMTTNVLTLDNGPTWVLDTACEQQTQQQEDMDNVDDEMITFEGLGPQIIQEPEQEDLQTVMNHVPDPVVEQVEPTRRSERPRVQPRCYDDFILNESLDVHTDDNIAYPLTKPMPRPKHESHTRAKGLKHIGEWL